MTHDMELRMPEMMFDGATVRISPRSFEGNGALVHFEIVPKAVQQHDEEQRRALELPAEASRFLLKPFKKISEYWYRNII